MDAEEDDYMADLSRFLPPEVPSPPKKICTKTTSNRGSLKIKKPKTENWQEQRKLDREQKQRREDEQTLAKCETSLPSSNVGFKMLQQMGYKPGSALGKQGTGHTDPIRFDIRRSRAGLGREDPAKEIEKKQRLLSEKKRKNEEDMRVDFASRQRLQWRNRRIVLDFNKAKTALLQLENEETLWVESGQDEDDGKGEKTEDDEEEEIITEEDLLDVLTKLRVDHHYCLYCGCQYESIEALQASCPGLSEDVH